MKKISIGKFRRLQQCATSNGGLAVLALDHRHNLREAFNPRDPAAVGDEELAAFKQDVVKWVSPVASAVLLDPEYGIGGTVREGILPGTVGLLAALEETGYQGETTARLGRLVEGWSVEKALQAGANAVKLLIYYHPRSRTAKKMEELVDQTAEQCKALQVPFFVEALSYSLDPEKEKLTPAERRDVVLESARRITPLGVDVFKAEFPLDIFHDENEKNWMEACSELSDASQVPWILLSASVQFDIYLRQLTIACEAGASGAAVGRAVWSEAVQKEGQARRDFLQGIARRRMQRVTSVCDALAKPWTNILDVANTGPVWYKAA
jgi:tagatose 1,6-diphosphate aldolase